MSAENNDYLQPNETTATEYTYLDTVPQNVGNPAVEKCPPYTLNETTSTGLIRGKIMLRDNGGYSAVGGAHENVIVNTMFQQREYIEKANTCDKNVETIRELREENERLKVIIADDIVVNKPNITGTVNDDTYWNAPTDYTTTSVLACLCCFWPMALCAIHYARLAKAFAAPRNFVKATRMSNYARNLMIGSIVIGIILIPLMVYLRISGHF